MRITTLGQVLEVPPPFQSVGDVVAGLAALDRQFRGTQDLRGLFVAAYVATTGTIAQWVDRGIFLDNPAMARYVIAFANEYRRALDDQAAGRHARIPVAWQQSFDACDQRLGIFQCLMSGINAHMSRDLPYAVIEAGIDVGSPVCYEDYVRIDEILRLNMPVVRQRISDAYGDELPLSQRWFGHFADSRIHRGFRDARENSWKFARMLAAAETEPARAEVDRVIEERAAAEGHKILGLARMVA